MKAARLRQIKSIRNHLLCDLDRLGYCLKRGPDRFNCAQSRSGENVMTKTSIVAAALLSLAIGLGPAWAQQDQPAAAAAPKAQMSPEKKAISKKCSDLANAKNLHGKERKKFRAECKHKGGNMPE
jgi:hypothetical protein